MPDSKLSALTAASSLADADLVYAVQGGTSKKGTVAQIRDPAALKANNLSDLANAATARGNLGLGSIATQAADDVNIDGGAIDGTTLGGSTAADATVEALTVNDEMKQVSGADYLTNRFSVATRFDQEMTAAYAGAPLALYGHTMYMAPAVTGNKYIGGLNLSIAPTGTGDIRAIGVAVGQVTARGDGRSFGLLMESIGPGGTTGAGLAEGAFFGVIPVAGNGYGVEVDLSGDGYTAGYRNGYCAGGVLGVSQSSYSDDDADGLFVEVYKETPIKGSASALWVGASADAPTNYGGIATFTIAAAGSGYAVNDVITVTGGDGSSGAIKVDTVDGSGKILTASVQVAGSNYNVENLLTQASVLPLGGTGAQFRVVSTTNAGRNSADVHGLCVDYASGHSAVYGVRVEDVMAYGFAANGGVAYGLYVDSLVAVNDAPLWGLYLVDDAAYFGGAVVTAVRSIVTAAGTTTALYSDHFVVFTGSTTQTYALPACTAGRHLIIKNRSSGNVTLDLAGADTADGSSSNPILTSNQSIHLVGTATGDWTIN